MSVHEDGKEQGAPRALRRGEGRGLWGAQSPKSRQIEDLWKKPNVVTFVCPQGQQSPAGDSGTASPGDRDTRFLRAGGEGVKHPCRAGMGLCAVAQGTEHLEWCGCG